MKGYAVSQRFERLEYRMAKNEEKIDFILKTSLPPKEAIILDGQIFDAYTLMCDLIRNAKSRIVMVDNYIDDSVFLQLDKRPVGVSATIFTLSISRILRQDLERHNAQYAPIEVKTFRKGGARSISYHRRCRLPCRILIQGFGEETYSFLQDGYYDS